MGGWFMAQCSIRVTLLCWCIDAIYYGGNILQWYIDSKHGCNQQQHYGIALCTIFSFFFMSIRWKHSEWCHYGIAGLKKKRSPFLWVMLGPAAPFSWCREGVECCPHWGQLNGVDRLWLPTASQLDGPGSICSLVGGGLPMPLKQKRLPDPSCHIASTLCVYLLLRLPINDEQCLFSSGFALPHSQWAKCIAATGVYWAIRLH